MKKKFFLLFLAGLIVASVLTLSACDKGDGREHFSDDTTYYYVSGSAVGNDMDGYLDKEFCTAEFSSDGKMVITLTPNPYIIASATIYLYTNRDNLAGINLGDMERYTSEVLPGESFFRLLSALEKLGDSIGLKVNGIDYEDEDVQRVFEEFEKTKQIPTFALPIDLTVTIEAPYALCEIASDFSDEPIRAIYLGDYDSVESDPYFLLTRYIDEEGREAFFLSNEVLSLRMDFAILD